MKKRRELKLLGNLPSHSMITPSMQKVIDFLEALPVDVVCGTDIISEEVRVSRSHLQNVLCRIGEKYRYRDGNTYGYGNPETVKLKKEGVYDRKNESEEGS